MQNTALGFKTPDTKIGIKPLLKWPGGKRELLKHIKLLIPKSYNTYYEPFLGGGALFFNLSPNRAVLGDCNKDLIQCYTAVRDNPNAVIQKLRQMNNSKEDYYKIRATSPITETEKAARFVYLVTLSFNGIYRVNLRGEFNVPYGYKTHVNPCDEESINAASKVLCSATLVAGDFESCLDKADKGDLVYLDPPYTVVHSHNGFLKYNDRIFSWDDQKRLASVARKLADKGCFVIVSNADHPEIHNLYRDFEVNTITRPSIIAASSKHRRQVNECLFYKE